MGMLPGWGHDAVSLWGRRVAVGPICADDGNSGRKTHPVGERPTPPGGFTHMHEMCSAVHGLGMGYAKSPAHDLAAPSARWPREPWRWLEQLRRALPLRVPH